MFSDVYYQEKSGVICYRSGLTVYEEAFESGTMYSCGWNAAGYPLNVLSGCPSRMSRKDFRRPCAFGIELDGESLDYGWSFKGCSVTDTAEGKLARVSLEHAERNISLCIATALDGTGIMSRHLEITNLSQQEVRLSRLAVMRGGIEIMNGLNRIAGRERSGLYSLGYMDNDETGFEGDFNWHGLHPDTTAFGGRLIRGRHRFPMFMLKNNIKGTVMTAQLAWSAGYSFAFDLETHPDKDYSKLSFEAGIEGNTPLYRIASGETFVSPQLEIGVLQGDDDEAVNRMNTHLRKSVLCLEQASGSACLVGSGMGAEHDMSVETTKRFIDQMAFIGCEVFIVDAGWNCPPDMQWDWYRHNGDWDADKQRYPGGIGEIRDYCHQKGMKFGMWMEPERVGEYSRVYREHPEWLTVKPDGERGCLLDLTVLEAAKWMESEIENVIVSNGLELFRLDYNVMSDELFAISKGKQGRECSSVRHTKALYAIFERLKKKFPDVIFENCASGGGRCDAGMMRFFNHTWVSDNQVPPMSRRITCGMTMVLPPERVDRLVAGMGCHTAASLDFHMRNAMLGHISMNVLSPRDACFNPQQLDFIRHSIEIYKSFIRPFLPQALIYHHTQDGTGFSMGRASVLELASCGRDRAAVTVLSAPDTAEKTVTVIPRGLAASGQYRVTFDNSGDCMCMTAAELMRGITVRIPASLSSELLLIERI